MVEVVALILALVIVPLTGGSFRRLARLEFDAPGLLFAGLAIQIVVEFTPLVPESRADDVGFALLLASYVLILSFGLLNLRITGMSIIVIGISLNVLVIALNQGMPYRVTVGDGRETSAKHRPERPDDVLTVLDDRIVIPGPLEETVSFGDLILALGIVNVAYRGSRRVRRSARVSPAETPARSDSAFSAPPPPGTVDGNRTAPRHVDLVAVDPAERARSGTRS
jgi:Family of unknown function (DUF5317)